jgi:hypothetical protein
MGQRKSYPFLPVTVSALDHYFVDADGYGHRKQCAHEAEQKPN